MNNQEIKERVFIQYQLNPTTTYVGIIAGNKIQVLKNFMKEVSNAFKFPNYYSGNMNSFLELMNDLSWLDANDYVLAITDSQNFLKNESEIDCIEIKGILNKISKEWINVPNYEGESEFRKNSRFIIDYM
ncbi:MAG: barstar family protein [Bacteroidetes bacterium]|nr:barstar family protein [Bacteroidota bacterium]